MEDKKNYIIYTRVSTKEQENKGVSIDAQLESCRNYVRSQGGLIVGEYNDADTGSKRSRHGLNEALADAELYNATVVIAKVDRLARDTEYAHTIKNSKVKLYFLDLPSGDDLTFGLYATLAELELKKIRQRTKDALNQIKRNIEVHGYHRSKNSGRVITKLGNPDIADYAHDGGVAASEVHREKKESSLQWRQSYNVATDQRRQGKTYKEITEFLNGAELKNSKGGTWSVSGVRKMLMD